MKSIAGIIILIVTFNTSYGQTWKEWFRQKKTQKEYLIQQIAALQVYLNYLKEGYKIVQKGMTVVGDIKEGNFNSHKAYFQSLKQVKGVISGSPKVSGIYAYQTLVVYNCEALSKTSMKTEYLSVDEKRYVQKVVSNMLTECQVSVSQLKDIVTSSEFEMKDDERLKRIDDLYNDMKEKYSFMRMFASTTNSLIVQREKEESTINNVKTLTETM
jgi:hypothetical protein